MKLSFDSSESIYSLFKRIQKIPSWRKVSLWIDKDHEFFKNILRGQQLKEIVENNNINLQCIVDNDRTAQYFKKLGFPVIYARTRRREQIANDIVYIIKRGKTIHGSLIREHSYISYLILLSELAILILVLYFFWGLISPNARVVIYPSYYIDSIVYNYRYYPSHTVSSGFFSYKRGLSIPYYTGSIPYHKQMTLNTENITYITKPSSGKVKIINTVSEPFSLLRNTKFITSGGLIFESKESIEIPPATSGGNYGTTTVTIKSLQYSEQGELIGSQGNVLSGTIFLIKNLMESKEEKKIYAIALGNFSGGETYTTGKVLQDDIVRIEQNIIKTMKEEMKEYLINTFPQGENIILPFNELIELQINEFLTTSHSGDNTSFVDGKVSAHINFLYIKRKDLIDAINTYLQQRPSSQFILLDYDDHSLLFYDIHKKDDYGSFYIPTKFNIIQGYNFIDDTNNLISEIKEKISGKSKDEARNILIEYQEIQDVDIRISPPRYRILPSSPSKIKIQTEIRKR